MCERYIISGYRVVCDVSSSIFLWIADNIVPPAKHVVCDAAHWRRWRWQAAARNKCGQPPHDTAWRIWYENANDVKSGELENIKKSINGLERDKEVYAVWAKKYNKLATMVRELEGELADFNLTFDKMRSDTSPDYVRHLCRALVEQNKQQRDELDQVFLEKKQEEKKLKAIEWKIEEIRTAASEDLFKHAPDKAEYDRLYRVNQEVYQMNWQRPIYGVERRSCVPLAT